MPSKFASPRNGKWAEDTWDHRPWLSEEDDRFTGGSGIGRSFNSDRSIDATLPEPSVAGIQEAIGSAASESADGGSSGDDAIWGGDGDDHLYGGSGSDILDGGDGYDFLDGGDGDDILFGHAGDTLKGGAGNDKFYLFTDEMIQLRDEGILLPGGDDPKYLDLDKWYVVSAAYGDANGDWIVVDEWAVPLVTILDLAPGDELYVDGKLITGKQVSYSAENGTYMSGTFSWMTPLSTPDQLSAYHHFTNPQEDTYSIHYRWEDYFDEYRFDLDDPARPLEWGTLRFDVSPSFQFVDFTMTNVYASDGFATSLVDSDLAFTAGLLVIVPNQTTQPLIPETIFHL